MELKNGDGMVWPGGAPIAVIPTFDFDAEYLRYSVIGRDRTGFADRSRGRYGPDEGLMRCLDMLRRQKIRTTFFVPGIVAEKYPEKVQEIAKEHELAYHGYLHDARLGIDYAEEERNMAQSEALLEKFSGRKVVGHRAPLDTMQTYAMDLLQKRGYLYSSNLKDRDWPYVHEKYGIAELPTEPGFDDFSWFYFSYADNATITCSYPAAYVRSFWQDAFDELLSEGDKVMVLKLHPQLIGRSSRIKMLEDLLIYMKKKGAWITSCEEAARHVLEFYKKRSEGGTR